MRFIFFTLFIISFSFAKTQTKKKIFISILPTYQNSNLRLDTVKYKLPNSIDSISFTKLKFYISSIKLLQNNRVVFAEKNSFRLIDFAKQKNLSFNIEIPKTIIYTTLQFNLGIDSATNAKANFANDLDPTNGMYWAWHSGFINFKLEGISPVCKTRNNSFEFHLGGFQYPFNSLQTIGLNITNAKSVNILFDLYTLFEKVDLSITNQIMTPSKRSNELMKSISQSFSIQ